MDPTPMVIDGKSVTADAVSDVRSPFDDRVVGSVPVGTATHLDAAVAAARQCHDRGALPAHQRAAILDEVAVALTEHAETLARGITAEVAKPITTARVEVARAIDTFRFAAATARTLGGEVVPLDASAAGEGRLGFTLRVPRGVVAAITPFNFPLNMVAHKVAPAIAAGCPVVLKPASATPLTALRLAGLIADAGLPPGWLNVVTCSGSVAEHLVTHPDVAMVTFTGSADVGWAIRARAPRKHVSLELGNNAPLIVADDATDIDDIARRIAGGAFGFAGQSCISTQRVYVVGDLADELRAAVVAAADRLVVGDPDEETTDVSALVTPAETARVRSVVEDAVEQGGMLLCGGEVVPVGAHGVLAPTVVDDLAASMTLHHGEVFGPVVGMRRCDSIDEAVSLANDTRYGLQAGVFTSSLRTATDLAQRLRFGGVVVNDVPTWRADQMPYGGVGDSGNTKEGPAWAARSMTVERMVSIRP